MGYRVGMMKTQGGEGEYKACTPHGYLPYLELYQAL